ncbi:hypothetical protein LUZ63_007592 [Rhynchospora breviuscula]|uniref:Plant heme peroxidase family profile domain-containing protein n=1 Tax=Rhynchospora breviuscula TaxID=2022672 RepID=A0A9Q0CSK7_9POAL|nr:hypothetical protein LUZ63_007592 [Rhynchospora breviuscula]
MAKITSSKTSWLLLVLCTLVANSSAQLSSSFYKQSCPGALSIIKNAVVAAVNQEAHMGASLLCLHFHDCFVQGYDESVHLDSTSTIASEKDAFPNMNSLRGFEVIDDIKSQLENVCPQTVSCADILTVAACDSVVALGGADWPVLLGRRDSLTASQSAANSDLPSPDSDLSNLICFCQKKPKHH